MGRSLGEEAGFGLLQILIAAIAIVPIIVVGIVRGLHEREPRAKVAQAEFETRLAAVVDGIGQQVLPARQSSLRTRKRVIKEDGTVAMSDWFTPVPGEAYSELRFSRVPFGHTGRSGHAATKTYVLRFAFDEGETENGCDDDGDGLIDEGVVELRSGERLVATLATRLRTCQFVVDDWKVSIFVEGEEPLERGYYLDAHVIKTFTLKRL